MVQGLLKIFKGEREQGDSIPVHKLGEEAKKKLHSFDKKLFDQKSFDDFAWIFRVYVRHRYALTFEFTFEELKKALEHKNVKHKEDLLKVAEKIMRVDYMNEKITDKQFHGLIEMFKKAI